jgi:hypothetical protein
MAAQPLQSHRLTTGGSTNTSTRQPDVALLARAGFSIDEFCSAVGYCRATFYNLPDELRPRSVLIRRRRIIVEPPVEYLARLAAAQTQGAADVRAR